MKRFLITGVITFCSLTSSNFFYQLAHDHNWKRAVGLSYFQLIAVVIFIIAYFLLNWMLSTNDK